MKFLLAFINPIDRIGNKKYSVWFPLLFTLSTVVLSEIYAYQIANNPEAVGTYIIFINVSTIIYFSFRDGIRAGYISTAIILFYYFYIIYTRDYQAERFGSGVITTSYLGIIYILLASTIGWLKQTIDSVVVKEKIARYAAQNSDRRKAEVINMASHELKTPITSLKLYLDILNKRLKNNKDETSLNILNKITSQIEKLNNLVNDLLDDSRIQTGKFSLVKEQFALDEDQAPGEKTETGP